MNLFYLLLATVLGVNDNAPRLEKKVSMWDKIKDYLEAFCYRHATLIFILLIVVLSALFVTICFAVCGVSAVESGRVYYHFGEML